MTAATTTYASSTSRARPVDLSRGLAGVAGLRGSAVRTGVKESGDPDLALLVADEPMNAAGVFTINEMAAAPVTLSRRALRRDPSVRSIVINSGNANALTGARGEQDARRMAETLVEAVGGPGIVLSTGIIGVPLPIDRVCTGIEAAAEALTDAFEPAVPQALRTTDTCNKLASVTVDTAAGRARVGGIAKGSGMIHPNMATMLAVVATDAPMDAPDVWESLEESVDESFHAITVDGDTSTNDAVILLAPKPRDDRPAIGANDRATVRSAITSVCRSLAEQIVLDGEGMSRVLEVCVHGARAQEDASAVAKAIACSSLVKTALAGGDPNWGRIVAAAGNAGVSIDPARVTLTLGSSTVLRRGEALPVDQAALDRSFSADRVRVELDLGSGSATARCLTTDLSHAYVSINSEYTT